MKTLLISCWIVISASAVVVCQPCRISHALAITDNSPLRNKVESIDLGEGGGDVIVVTDVETEIVPLTLGSRRAALVIECDYPLSNPGVSILNIFYHHEHSSLINWILYNFPVIPHSDTLAHKFYFTPEMALESMLPDSGRFSVVSSDSVILELPVLPDPVILPFIPVGENISATLETLEELKKLFPQGTMVDSVPPVMPLDSFTGPYWGRFPNIDLDSSKYPPGSFPGYAGDQNACTAAAIANSMTFLKYLPAVKEKLEAAFGNDSLSQRKAMVEASKFLKRKTNKGAFLDTMIMAKLEFIDKYMLPLRVEYQSLRIKADEIASPDGRFGHVAKNVSQMDTSKPNAKVTLEWMKEQVAKGCDVEMHYYCFKIDSTSGEMIRDSTGNPVTPEQHCVTVNGVAMQGDRWGMYYVDDYLQNKKSADSILRDTYLPLYIEPDTADKNLRGLVGFVNHYPNERCYIMQVEAECFDSTITFMEQQDSDCDRVPDENDQCPGGDDSQDNNGDNLSDCKNWPGLENIPESWFCGRREFPSFPDLSIAKVQLCVPHFRYPDRRRTICLPAFAASVLLRFDGFYLGGCGSSACEDGFLTTDEVSVLREWNPPAFDEVMKHGGQIQIYPNPSRFEITILVEKALEKQECSLIDGMGRVIATFSLNQHESHVDVRSLTPGLYTFVVSTDWGVFSKRFQKI